MNEPLNGSNNTIVLLYENETWNVELAAALAQQGFDVQRMDVRQMSFALDESLPRAVYFNRLSPSASARGHGAALELGRLLIRKLEADGQRVVNGSEALSYELNKVRQYLALRRLGVDVPNTVVLSSGAERTPAIRDLNYPAILKPNTGGSGVGVALVESAEQAIERVRRAGDTHESWLLQEKIVSADGDVLRLELVGDRLVYAMRVRAVNTFNLCPSEACVRPPADARLPLRPEVTFEHEGDPDPGFVRAARRVLTTIGLEVGGVEIMIDASGRAVFIDVNATSVYRRDIALAAGVDPYRMLADYLRNETPSKRHVA